jgi:hypothetical protein
VVTLNRDRALLFFGGLPGHTQRLFDQIGSGRESVGFSNPNSADN